MRRVLVVERDSLHHELIREWLEAGGMQAVWPQPGAQAAPDIDAVLVDVTCQQQAHAVLASWRRAYPQAAIVLASGRFSPGDMANDAMAVRLGATRILAKPYTRSDLWKALGVRPVPANPSTPPSR
ncbi:MAG TPA: response regulator [Steroidobacteraceae bacterium]|nr:response regulator [Steroidobacteraceae bacterium]